MLFGKEIIKSKGIMTRKRRGKGENPPESYTPVPAGIANYSRLLTDISGLLEQARRTAARTVNGILTATYWEVGRRIVEYEQGGKARAGYGKALLVRLGGDLSKQYGRGFSWRNLYQMRGFYLGWEILQTPSAELAAQVKVQTPFGISRAKLQIPSARSAPALTVVPMHIRQGIVPVDAFPLSWSQYVRLMAVTNPRARAFYESEALRGGWSVRQLDRQIGTQYFERVAHSQRQGIMLSRGRHPEPEEAVSPEDEVRDPYLLEFLGLKDEYSESELEEAIIRHLEWFLLELGSGFTFIARQKRIRVGDEWYRIDLLLFHRRLKCLVVIDLKIGKFTHADAGQMNLYLNYAREHLMEPGESRPVGLILCSAKNDAVAHYAMGGIRAKVFTSHYLTGLPDEETLRREILATQRAIQVRQRAEMK